MAQLSLQYGQVGKNHESMLRAGERNIQEVRQVRIALLSEHP